MWSHFLIRSLHLSGVWQGLLLHMNTRVTRIRMRLDHVAKHGHISMWIKIKTNWFFFLKRKIKVTFKALDLLWLLLHSNSDSETLDIIVMSLSHELLTECDKFWCNPMDQSDCAHKKGPMALNVWPTSAYNSGSTFPSFLFHSVSLFIFLENFVKGDVCVTTLTSRWES